MERCCNVPCSSLTNSSLAHLWTLGLLGLLNCCRITPLPSHLFFMISSALAMAPFTPLSAGVSTSSAPIQYKGKMDEEGGKMKEGEMKR